MELSRFVFKNRNKTSDFHREMSTRHFRNPSSNLRMSSLWTKPTTYIKLQWEAKVERGQQEFDQISRVIKKEVERWEEARLDELRTTLLRYLDEHMKHQAKVSRLTISLF